MLEEFGRLHRCEEIEEMSLKGHWTVGSIERAQQTLLKVAALKLSSFILSKQKRNKAQFALIFTFQTEMFEWQHWRLFLIGSTHLSLMKIWRGGGVYKLSSAVPYVSSLVVFSMFSSPLLQNLKSTWKY